MPFTTGYTKTLTIDGVAYQQTSTATSDGKGHVSVSVPAAVTGTLTTRTDNDTGVLTMTAGHGFSTGNKVDVFWNGGSRRDMTATVAVNAVTVDGGSGDSLPALNAAITAMLPVIRPFTFTSTAVEGLAFRCPVSGWVAVYDDANVLVESFRIPPNTGFAVVWSGTGDEDNPLGDNLIGSARFSHADSSQAQVMEAVVTF